MKKLLALVVLLFACTSIPSAPTEQDRDAKRFTAPTSRARVYVYRPGMRGGAVAFQVLADGRVMGNLPIQSFVSFDVKPGRHVIAAAAEGGQRNVTLETEAGKLYFIRLSNMGAFTVETEGRGRTAIVQLRRTAPLAESLE